MDILIFKTNIRSKSKAKTLQPIFNNHPVIADWSVDTEDVDKVLRIESTGMLPEVEVIDMVQHLGFYCEVMVD